MLRDVKRTHLACWQLPFQTCLYPLQNSVPYISIGSSMYLYLLQMQLSLTNAVITLTLLFPGSVSSYPCLEKIKMLVYTAKLFLQEAVITVEIDVAFQLSVMLMTRMYDYCSHMLGVRVLLFSATTD